MFVIAGTAISRNPEHTRLSEIVYCCDVRDTFSGPGGAELIGQQRRQMFLDAGQPDDDLMAAMERDFVPWVRTKLFEDRYIGWLASEEGNVVGGAGLWLMDFPPHFLDAEPVRAYLLNFYTAPEFRGRGLANSLLDKCVEEARRRGCGVVTLHASKFGRPIYEKKGFRQNNEMMLLFNDRNGYQKKQSP